MVAMTGLFAFCITSLLNDHFKLPQFVFLWQDSPINKLLYARDIPRYKQMVERWEYLTVDASDAMRADCYANQCLLHIRP